jgi:hypothetical protein
MSPNIPTGNRAISSINLLKNQIPVEQAQELVKIMQAKENLTTLCGLSREKTELDFSSQNLGAGDAVLIANDISDMRAISTLNLMGTGLTHGAQKAYPGQYSPGNEGFRVEAEWGTKDSDFDTDMSGIIALANAIPDMGAISSANLLKNDIGVEQAGALVIILKEHPTLKSLCGNKGDETELDMSGKMKGAEDAVMLAAEFVDNGALTSLNLSSNDIGQLVQALPEGWSEAKDPSSGKPYFFKTGTQQTQWEHPADKTPVGAITLANAISDMEALTKLTFGDMEVVTMTTEITVANFSGKLRSYEAQIVAAFLPKCT